MATTSTSNIERARELMRRSRREHFAVGAFNVDNQETLLAIVRAARAKEAPVLVEVSHDEVSMIGLANIGSMVDNYRAEYGVEIYVNLDHSPSVEAAKAGIDAGFEFIHIDYSQANRDATEGDIIGAILEVDDYARQTTGALIEVGAALLRRLLQRPLRGDRLRRDPQDLLHPEGCRGVRR
jgi:fructose/tagatose bisphosphate aldolase